MTLSAFKAASPSGPALEIVSGGVPVDKKLAHGELTGLAEMPYLFGLAYYAGEFSGINRLYSLFNSFSTKLANKKKWNIANPGTLEKASQIALDMHLYPQHYSLCKSCRGSGSQKRGKVCNHCHGTGTKPITDAQLAYQLGISRSNMQRTWSNRLNILYTEAQALHAIINNHLKYRNKVA